MCVFILACMLVLYVCVVCVCACVRACVRVIVIGGEWCTVKALLSLTGESYSKSPCFFIADSRILQDWILCS